MDPSLESLAFPALAATAAFMGFFHTVIGPDHYVPFIAMAKIGRWSLRKACLITVLCGVGHVLSSVVLGLAGIAAGRALGDLMPFELSRGDVAGWLLLGFGVAYLVWGVYAGLRNRPHTHWHAHADGTMHLHEHVHEAAHAHPHAQADDAQELRSAARSRAMTPWILFTIFVFGPCEPLIPMMFVAEAKLSGLGAAAIALAFSVATIGTMLAFVLVGYYGVVKLSIGPLRRYGHALAGLAIVACAALMKLGL